MPTSAGGDGAARLLEGRRGQPRLKPRSPAVAGLYACPTVVNNVETIANVPYIVNNGVDWFRSFGTDKSRASRCSQSPDMCSALASTRRRWHADVGTARLRRRDPRGHTLKFWLPGGSSVPMLTPEHIDLPMTYEAMAEAGSMMGTGTPMLYDDTTSVVRAVTGWLDFYKHESCGKCTPCREGNWFIHDLVHRFDTGRGERQQLKILDDVRADHGPLVLRPR